MIIGSSKCGTTSLHRYLNMHPDIYLPIGVGINDESGLFLHDDERRIKRLSSRDIRQGMSDLVLYERIMEDYGGEAVIGEETTDYTKKPYRKVCFDRIDRHNPEMKFIFIARDPIEKLRSHFRHFVRHGALALESDFTKEIEGFDYYMYASSYYYQLKPYIERYGRERIHILVLEELSKNPVVELGKVFRFLGVEEIDFKIEELPRFNVNHEMDDEMLSGETIPAKTLDFIASDMERFQAYIGRDLHDFWPSLRGSNERPEMSGQKREA